MFFNCAKIWPYDFFFYDFNFLIFASPSNFLNFWVLSNLSFWVCSQIEFLTSGEGGTPIYYLWLTRKGGGRRGSEPLYFWLASFVNSPLPCFTLDCNIKKKKIFSTYSVILVGQGEREEIESKLKTIWIFVSFFLSF